MTRKRESEKIKAAVLSDLMAGEQPAIVAQRYGIDMAKVRVWKQRYVTGHVTQQEPQQTVIVQPSVIDYQQRVSALIYELLIEKLEASRRLALHTQPDWIERQSAEGLAELGNYLDRTAAGILSVLIRRGGSAELDADE